MVCDDKRNVTGLVCSSLTGFECFIACHCVNSLDLATPPPTILLSPHFPGVLGQMRKTPQFSRPDISFGLYGNACYAGYFSFPKEVRPCLTKYWKYIYLLTPTVLGFGRLYPKKIILCFKQCSFFVEITPKLCFFLKIMLSVTEFMLLRF